MTKRAPTRSPRRHIRWHARRTDPLEFNTITKTSGIASVPICRQTPLTEMSVIEHSIQGASGSQDDEAGLLQIDAFFLTVAEPGHSGNPPLRFHEA